MNPKEVEGGKDIMDGWDGMTNSWPEFGGSLLPHLGESLGEVTTLKPGQVWRARWDDVVSMVFVDKKVGTFQNLLRVAPVTVGKDMADEWTVILPADSTSLSVSLSVWTELATDVAEVVLERFLVNVHQHTSLAELLEASETGALRRGLPILNESGRRAEERRQLAFMMEALKGAVSLISGNGSLPDMLAAASVSMAAIMQVLAADTPFALRIFKGTANVDVAQARAIAPLLGADTSAVLAGNPVVEEELVAAVTKLSVRPRLEQLEALDGLDDTHAFVTLTKGVLALAARKEGDENVWDSRVDLYFESRFGKPFDA